jgi:uncharacterized protein
MLPAQRGVRNGLRLHQLAGKLLSKNIGDTPAFSFGFVNGLLPCGLVYMALTAAAATGSISGSATIMLGFALGTVPTFLILLFIGKMAPPGLKRFMNRLTPAVIVVMGILLILRGLGLGVAYVSPAIKAEKTAVVIHCH